MNVRSAFRLSELPRVWFFAVPRPGLPFAAAAPATFLLLEPRQVRNGYAGLTSEFDDGPRSVRGRRPV